MADTLAQVEFVSVIFPFTKLNFHSDNLQLLLFTSCLHHQGSSAASKMVQHGGKMLFLWFIIWSKVTFYSEIKQPICAAFCCFLKELDHRIHYRKWISLYLKTLRAPAHIAEIIQQHKKPHSEQHK